MNEYAFYGRFVFHLWHLGARIKSAKGVQYYQWYVQHNQWDKTGPTPTALGPYPMLRIKVSYIWIDVLQLQHFRNKR